MVCEERAATVGAYAIVAAAVADSIASRCRGGICSICGRSGS